jgi:hypothetical protein
MSSVSNTRLCALVLLSVSCGGRDSQVAPEDPIVYDSAGVAIVDNGMLDLGKDLLSAAMPSLQIGLADGPEEYQLFQVADAKRLSDGAIAVVNQGSHELRIYEADGAHRATAGGRGQGPREFRNPSAIVILPGDTIQVQDDLDRVYFTARGSFVRRVTGDTRALAALREAAGGLLNFGEAVWMADGTLFAAVIYPPPGPPWPQTPFRPRAIFLRVASDLASLDTLGEWSGPLGQFVEISGDISFVEPPFSPETSWALGSADGMIVVGDNAVPQFERFHSDSRRTIIRWTANAEAVTEADVEAWKEPQRNGERPITELERIWSTMVVPNSKPFYGNARTGSDGSVWVSSLPAMVNGTQVVVFNSDGQYAGAIAIPVQFEVHDAGSDWVLGIMRDESDVEHIWLYDLRAR